MNKKLKAIMTALKKGFWTTAVPTEPLSEYINPDFTHAGHTEDELFFIYVKYYADKAGVTILPFDKWPKDWLKLTATELSAAI